MNPDYKSSNRSNPHEEAMRVATYLTAAQRAASHLLEGGERLIPLADIALFHEGLKRGYEETPEELERFPYSPLVRGFLQLITPTIASLIGEERSNLV